MTKTKSNTKPKKQPVSGIFLLDKPKGLSSNAAMQKVRWLFNAAKAGHTGALDPMATGLLPVCLGEATKFSHALLDSDKSYLATVCLGAQTNTGDAEGVVVQTADVPSLSRAQVTEALTEFMGAQRQVPPMYSALKKDGKKLYELARAGVEVERKPRDIHIYKLELVELYADSLVLAVTCSKGTYVRVLGEDIAKHLGTLGHLTALRRTQTGRFDLENSLTLEALEALKETEKLATLLPSYASIAHLPKLVLDDEQAARIRLGQRLNVFAQAKGMFQKTPNAQKLEVLMFEHAPDGDKFLGAGLLEPSGRLQPKRLVNILLGV